MRLNALNGYVVLIYPRYTRLGCMIGMQLFPEENSTDLPLAFN
ncbi:hypothetical protein EV08_0039 [Prochlorococcus marinus str. SS2]|nr:hypothetical protein EV08_0039 [Prochlorococcus marinus str. SS2]